MEKAIEVGQFLIEKGPFIISSVVGMLSVLIGLFMLIPGEQPEKAMQGIVDFLGKFSRKPLE